MYINELTVEQIADINAFLAPGSYVFDEKHINFFNQITQADNDPLGLIGHSEIGIRGQIIEIMEGDRLAGLCYPTDQTPEELHAIYLEEMNAEHDQYSDEDFEALCNDHLAARKAEVPKYGLLLVTTNITGYFDILLLNSEFKPIAETLSQLKCL